MSTTRRSDGDAFNLFLAGLHLPLFGSAHLLLAILSLLALFATALLHLLADALLNRDHIMAYGIDDMIDKSSKTNPKQSVFGLETLSVVQ